jgi:hypothetical protein
MTTDMERVKQDLLGLGEYAYQRLRARLLGLTDEEYRWEPAPGCWSIRPAGDGTWTADGSPLPVRPAPLTTIAWRLDHLIFVLAGERNATWIGATPVGTLERDGAPATVAAAIEQLERAYALFKGNVGAANAADLGRPMGEIAGGYAKDTRTAFVLHELDELVHHGSEIAAMRDFYRATTQVDPIVEAAAEGDRAVVEERLAVDPTLRTSGLVADMAARQRWDSVRMLVGLGFDVTTSAGITALHYAAAAGDRDLVDLLLRHGADPAARDTEFDHDPAGWARFFGHDDVAEYLGNKPGVSSAG